MKIKKNILKYKNPTTGEYDPIPVVATDGVTKENIEAALGYTPADDAEVHELNEKLADIENKFEEGNINFFNPSAEIVEDYYIETNGDIKPYSGWSYVEVALEKGNYMFSFLDNRVEIPFRSILCTLYYASYDENGAFIQGSGDYSNNTGLIKVPEGAKKTLISSHTGILKTSTGITDRMLCTKEYYDNGGEYVEYSDGEYLKDEYLSNNIVRKSDLDNMVASGFTSELLGKNSNVFDTEINDTIQKILSFTEKPCLIMPLITDSHYDSADDDNKRRTLDTFKNLKAICKNISCDGVIHLGDVLTYNGTCDTIEKVNYDNQYIVNLMRECSDKVYVVNGNHDGINGSVPQTQNYPTYGKVNSLLVTRVSDKPYFYVDYEHLKVRLVFMATNERVDNSNVWGCSNSQLSWFENVLTNTPNDYNIMIFSHIGTFDTNDYKTNRDSVCNLVNSYNSHSNEFSSKQGKIISWFTGHEHLDCILPQVASGVSCPQITSQCSFFSGWTPTENDGYIYPYDWTVHVRTDGTVSQDCFDVMIYRPDENKIYLLRFGAGEDREINLN